MTRSSLSSAASDSPINHLPPKAIKSAVSSSENLSLDKFPPTQPVEVLAIFPREALPTVAIHAEEEGKGEAPHVTQSLEELLASASLRKEEETKCVKAVECEEKKGTEEEANNDNTCGAQVPLEDSSIITAAATEEATIPSLPSPFIESSSKSTKSSTSSLLGETKALNESGSGEKRTSVVRPPIRSIPLDIFKSSASVASTTANSSMGERTADATVFVTGSSRTASAAFSLFDASPPPAASYDHSPVATPESMLSSSSNPFLSPPQDTGLPAASTNVGGRNEMLKAPQESASIFLSTTAHHERPNTQFPAPAPVPSTVAAATGLPLWKTKTAVGSGGGSDVFSRAPPPMAAARDPNMPPIPPGVTVPKPPQPSPKAAVSKPASSSSGPPKKMTVPPGMMATPHGFVPIPVSPPACKAQKGGTPEISPREKPFVVSSLRDNMGEVPPQMAQFTEKATSLPPSVPPPMNFKQGVVSIASHGNAFSSQAPASFGSGPSSNSTSKLHSRPTPRGLFLRFGFGGKLCLVSSFPGPSTALKVYKTIDMLEHGDHLSASTTEITTMLRWFPGKL